MMERSHSKKRKYTISNVHYSSHQNGTNHTRTYSSPVHHSPRRFYSSEKSRGHSRSNNSSDMCNGDSGTLPFYEHSPSYERTNKGKLHRQDPQPYWCDNPNHELSNVSRYSLNPHPPNSCEHPYGNRQTKEPYWVDTVGRKTNYSSPKLIHVSEKRPTRQTKEPYWMESFEHYEVQSHEENSEPIEDFAPPPMVHRELPTPAPQYDRSLSYRFPNQDPQYLKKRFLSLKRKLKDTATVTTTDTKTSKSVSSDKPPSKKKECNKEENIQGSSSISRKLAKNLQDSSNSIVATYDTRGNFIVVSKESSSNTRNKQSSSSSFLDRFGNNPEGGDKLSFGAHEKKGTSCQDQQSGLKKVTEIGPIEQTLEENQDHSLIPEVKNCKENVIKVKIKENSTSDAKDNNVDTESEAESEVFDDIFFQTISKELENDVYLSEEEKSLKDKPTQAKDNAKADDCMDIGLDCDLLRSEGSISPTFDSTLLRYLDDNIRNRMTVDKCIKRSSDSEKNEDFANANEKDFNERSEDVIELRQENPKDSRQTCDTLTSDSDSHEKDYSEVKRKVDGNRKLCYGRIESENSQECVGDVEKNDSTTKVSQSPYHQINNIIENEDNCRPAAKTESAANEDKNNSGAPFTTSEISKRVEKSAEAFLEFDRDSASSTVQECSSIKISFDVLIDEKQLSLRQAISETSGTRKEHHLTAEKIDRLLKEKPREEKRLYTKGSCETANSSGTCTASLDKMSSCEQSQHSEMENDSFSETVMKNDKAEVVATVQDQIHVDEGIRLIREKCKTSISVRQFESVLNVSTEVKEKTTANEVSKASVSKDGGQYSQQIWNDSNSFSSDTKKNPLEDNEASFNNPNPLVKDNEGAFVPLCEDLLLSVKKELRRKEGETHEHDDSCCTENTCKDVALSSDSTENARPETAEDSNVYNILHSAVLASKVTGEHVPNEPFKIPVSDITISSTRDLPSDNDSIPITKAIRLVEGNIKDLKIGQGLVKSNIQNSTSASQSEVEVSSIDSAQDSLPDDKNTSNNKTGFCTDLIAKMPFVLEKEVGGLEKEIVLPKISTEPRSKDEEKKNVASQVDTMTSDVKETLMLENRIELKGLFAPQIQAKHHVEQDLISTCNSKKMEIDDLNFSTLCTIASMEDHTPSVAEDLEKNGDCSTLRDVDTSAVKDKTPEAKKSPENIQALDCDNLQSNPVDAGPHESKGNSKSNAHDVRVWSIEGETPQERKVNKSDVKTGNYKSDGNDEVSKSDGDDQVSKSDGDDQVSKSDGNDEVSKSHGNDEVSKSDGDDQVLKSDGDDQVSKSDENDEVSKSNGDDQVSKSDGDDQVSKSDGDDQVSKSDGDDQLSKSDGDDQVSKSDGDDQVSKSDANDEVSKSDGNDEVSKSDGDDQVSKSDANDEVSKSDGNDEVSKSDGDDQVSKSDANDEVSKSDGNDEVSKSDGDDQVSKSDGNDEVSKSHGNDEVSKSDGDDEVSKSDGNDEVSKSDGNDEVSKSDGNGQVSKSDGNDEVSKSDEDDQVSKSDADDEVSKSDGDVQVSKSDADDRVLKTDGNDEVSKSDKDDQVSKSDEDGQVSKSREDDQVSKSDGDNKISRKSGEETVLIQGQKKSYLADQTIRDKNVYTMEGALVVQMDTLVLHESKHNENLTSSKEREAKSDRLICKDLLVYDERKLNKIVQKDVELEKTTAALYKFLESNPNNFLSGTLKDIKRQDSPSSSPVVRSPSQDSIMTETEDAYVDTLLLEADQLSDVDTSSRGSSDVEMEDDTKEDLDLNNTNQESDLATKSNEIGTIGNQELNVNLSLVGNSSLNERQSTLGICIDSQRVSRRIFNEERKKFGENTKDVLRKINEPSMNTTELFKDSKDLPENCKAGGSENNAFLCKSIRVFPKNTKEVTRIGKDVSLVNREFFFNDKDVSKNTITPRNVSAGMLKRRSPRQKKQMHDKNLSSRQIPYYRDKTKACNGQFLKDSIEYKGDVKVINGGFLEIDEEQLIDIMEIDYGVDDFHFELDASEEESPKKLCNLPTGSRSAKIASKNSFDYSLIEQTNDSLGRDIKPSKEVGINSKLIDNPSTHVKSMVNECFATKLISASCPSDSLSRRTIPLDSCEAKSPRPSCSSARDKCVSKTNSLNGCLGSRGRHRRRRRKFPQKESTGSITTPLWAYSSDETTAKVPLKSSQKDRRTTELEVCIDTSDTIGSDKSSRENVNISEDVSTFTSVQSHTSCKVDPRNQRSDENRGIFSFVDVYSSNSSSSPASSLCMEDVSSQCSTESLKVSLISETNPSTGKMNWMTDPRKPTEFKKEVSTSYGLRPSKTRKMKNPSPTPTGPNAKKRRMTITDLRSGMQNPQKLHDLAKRPLEKYIRSVEKVFRSSDKNPKKGMLSIAMNDHISKTTLQNQEGDYLKLGDTDVMYEIVKKAFDESKFKRCRPSPRSLYFAAKQGNALQVLVLASGCNVNATIPQEKHKTAMHAASAAGHVNVLRLLCMVGGNLSCLDTNLQTPLFDAVENQRTEVVKFLISRDVNLNLKDSQGMTVLHVAAQKSNLEIINLLMETRRLSVNEQDNGGWTALMWTAEGMRKDVARCLLKWGADVNILDTEQNTCLHWAALAGDTEIMDLLLGSNVHIDARNMFGATALHISARERKLPNIKTLEKYRPNVDIKNAEGKTAIELVPSNSKCYFQLKRIEMLMNLAKSTLKERLVSRDISRGQERRPIPCINGVDEDDLPNDFVYVSNNLENQSQGFDRSMTSCNCTDGCVNDKLCECAQLSTRKRFWYGETGRINSEIFEEDRPLVYECNMKCKCWSNCHQRVVQHGITAGLQLYKTEDKGWAVRTQAFISKGTFVCEYVGEILTDNEADRRKDDCYLFDLDVKGQSTLFCLDAKFYGNITRFINHSCDPNILPVRVFTDHQVKSCPRIAFFAARDIKPYEEVCSNYGEKFWTVKKSEFHCVCNTSKCRYGPGKKQ